MRLIEPTEFAAYIPLIKEIDFGNQEQFLVSCAQYLSIINPRRKVLLESGEPDIWEQRIAYLDDNFPLIPVGITGWYLWPPFTESRIWLGWFGIRDCFKGKGYGTILLKNTEEAIRKIFPDIQWLYVFTDSAEKFYVKSGFEYLGTATVLECNGHLVKDSTFEPEDIVLRKHL